MPRLLTACLLFAMGEVSAAGRVVLVSVDGLRPDIYLEPETHGVELPAFRQLMLEGAYAERVEGVYPTMTYPSHASIATGVLPARHGILNNTLFDGNGDWYWHTAAMKRPALWDVARGKTAAINWPVTVGAEIDLNFPEFWIPGSERSWRDVMSGVASPAILETIEAELGPLPDRAPDEEPLEDFVFAAASIVLSKHRPELLLVHVINTDTKQHRHGREHREVAAAFERVDQAISRLRRRIEELGLSGETLFVVTGDHGFIDVHTRIHLNAAFRRAGLIDVAPDGGIRDWRARSWTSGGSSAVILKDPNDAEVRGRVESVVAEMLSGPMGGILTRVSREELDGLGAMPEALFALEAEEGYTFGTNVDGEILTPSDDLGYHGFLPGGEKIATGFLMVGPGVRKGVRVPRMRQIDIAPTIAAWAGWELGEVDGLALTGLMMGGRE
jgi:hypothetical protein